MNTKKLMRPSGLAPLLLTLLAVGMLAMLAACGSDAATPTPTAAAAEAPVAAVATPTPTAMASDTSDIVDTSPIPAVVRTGEKPEYGGTMFYGRTRIPSSVDQYHIAGSRSDWGNLYQNALVQVKFPYDPSKGLEHEPGLATEWSLSADGTKYTFKLRQGVTFHDGELFNADDVVATVGRVLDDELLINTAMVQMRQVFEGGVRKVDDYTAILDTGTPNSAAFAWFGSILLNIAPAHLIIGDPASTDPEVRWKFIGPDPVKQTGTLLVGTGPFIHKVYNPEVENIGERNPNYWKRDSDGNPLPYLDRAIHRAVPDGTRALANFVAGSLRYSGGTSHTGIHPRQAEQLCRLSRDTECYTVPGPHGNFAVVLQHNTMPVFQDDRGVAAIRYSVDMQDIFDKAYGGYLGFTWMDRTRFPETALPVKEQYGLMPWSDPDRRPEFVQKAKDLLTEAGYPEGIDLPLPLFGSCSGVFLDKYTYMSDYMSQAGFRNFLECRVGIVRRDEQKAGRFSVSVNNISQYKVDPGHMISITALLDSPAVGGSPWRWGPNQQMIDARYRDTVQTLDASRRNEKYRDMERVMADLSMTVYPAGYSSVAYTVHGCVRNFHPGGTWDSANYSWERVWLTAECR